MRPLGIAFCLFILSACGGVRPSVVAPPSAASDALGEPVSLSLPTDDGRLFVLEDQQETVVLDLWAPSCTPCRETVPALVARQAALAEVGASLVLVAVLSDTEETTEQARETLVSWGVHESFVVDREDAARGEFGIEALPATVIVKGGVYQWLAPVGTTADEVVAAAR